MSNKVKITDLDVNRVDVQMPYELKREIAMVDNVLISEDMIQVVLVNPGNSTVSIWVYKTSTEVWTRICLT
jgi:hypothetical protein